MYSNERKNGFSILDLLVKIIFAAVFIFILIWLFNKKMPKVDMTPIYSNVFRENIKYMQEAGENYFTDDKMPTEVGETYKLTLDEMEKMNLIIPFVDKDGNACNKTDSYVSITKLEENAGYELKTNLVCGKEANYVNKILGCHNYCPTGNCQKKCSISKITEYEFKKLVNGSKTKYSCDKGYTLKGKYCIKKSLKDSYDGSYKTTETKTITRPATVVVGEAKLKQLKTIVTDKKTQLTTVVTDKKTQLTTTVTSKTTELDVNKTSKEETYSCEKTKTETKCTTRTERKPYSCNCKTTIINGKPTTTCDTCYETVQVQDCKDVEVVYTGTCTKTVYTYSCPKDATSSTGSGANLKCYKKTNVYSCPSGTTTQEGSGANLKCYKVTKVYSCPKEADVKEGSGANLKCYKTIAGEVSYKCDAGFKLSDKTCTKTETSTVTKYRCTKDGYVLEGKNCNLYKTAKVKAKAKTSTKSYYIYKWSEKTSLKGYTRTGKTRTVDGKEVCE